MLIKEKSERGDTIVEVLIVLTILVFVLTGAYQASYASLSIERTAAQRGQALQLAQGQIEILSSDIAFGYLPPLSPPFCLITNASGISPIDEGGATIAPPYDPATFPAQCNVDSKGNAVSIGSGLFYTLSIEQPSAHLYRIQVNWYASYAGYNNVTLFYRSRLW
jgi:type II secretory pathway pseudopilin PulG